MASSPTPAPAPLATSFPAPPQGPRHGGGMLSNPPILTPQGTDEGPMQQNRFLGIRMHGGEDTLLLTAVEGAERLSQPFEFHLELQSLDHQIDPRAMIGQEVVFRIGVLTGRPRYFHGYFSQFTVGSVDGEFRCYRAVVVPWIWFLGKTSDCRIFQDKTALEIVQEIFSDPEIAAQAKVSLNGLQEPGENRRRYCVQYRESDLNFVSRLLEDEGIFYYFKHTTDGHFGAHELVLSGARRAESPASDGGEIVYRPDAGEANVPDGIFHWERSCQYITDRVSFRDYDYHFPMNDLRAEENTIYEQARTRVAVMASGIDGSCPGPGADGRLEQFDYPGGYDDYDEGNYRARNRMQEEEVRYDTIRAGSTCNWLAAGSQFTLAPRSGMLGINQTRGFKIIDIHHYAREPSSPRSREQATEGKIYTNRFTCIDVNTPYYPHRKTPKPVVQGTQTATVTGLKDSEIYTDGCGRVKVQFRWDRRGTHNQESSCWVRVAQSWAGKKWGAFFWPRLDDEVVVAFEEGDPDRPLIVGSVYNDSQKPPYPLPQHQTVSGIKTCSSRKDNGYNELRFEDRKDAEQIMIHGQRRMDQVVRGSLYETNGGNREVRVGGEKGGDCNTFVHNDSNEHVVEKQYSLVDGDVHRVVKGDVLEKFDKNHKVCVGEIMRLSANDLITETANGISQKSSLMFLEGTEIVSTRGGEVMIEATHGLSLKVGGSFIHITPKEIRIEAPKVFINSGGKAPSAIKIAPAPDFEVLEAIDAAAATTKLPGTGGGGGGGGRRTHRSVTAAAHHARPYSSIPPGRPSADPPENVSECIESLEGARRRTAAAQETYEACRDETDADGNPANQTPEDVNECVRDSITSRGFTPRSPGSGGPCTPYLDEAGAATDESRAAHDEEILREHGRWDPETGTYQPTSESDRQLDDPQDFANSSIDGLESQQRVLDRQIDELQSQQPPASQPGNSNPSYPAGAID